MNRRALLAALPAASLLPATAGAQAWPDQPIRGIVPFAPGSATDTVARVVAEGMRPSLGQPVVVENRAGANGLIGAEAVARAAPDGNTVLIGTNSTNAAANALFRRVPFDMENGFIPVSTIATVPLLVAVKADSPYRTLAELIAAAKARPEGITFASASASQRVATESLAAMAGIKMLHVPYRSSPLAVQDVLSGRVDLFIADQAVILPQAQAGALRILGVTSGQRSGAVPEIPTVREAGNLPDYEVIAWFALFVPAGTPAERVTRLNRAVNASLELPETRARLGTFGMDIRGSTPADAVAFVRAETAKWTAAIRMAGIEPE
ncbi:tripartite tricarboxylate transporter substrate binding protein [Roseomonas terrae]|jgi:tripartite-type tricarboxylate transporter receptor subunit TctC|uniref:Tripartite tricarboxylate transporter substrate binding protein n=1 Tax=Neoroseomonas terrae TaxID=424799 RepID=A0ABS5EJP3_9PROT|nr:tripartite tricarboxylate transporter substrate binding protein [Neoroseomonas terrae]MBR0651247.1 tripartite tricarboxylate transporter substrate binding protein [Neoroseomonas terrae]